MRSSALSVLTLSVFLVNRKLLSNKYIKRFGNQELYDLVFNSRMRTENITSCFYEYC